MQQFGKLSQVLGNIRDAIEDRTVSLQRFQVWLTSAARHCVCVCCACLGILSQNIQCLRGVWVVYSMPVNCVEEAKLLGRLQTINKNF